MTTIIFWLVAHIEKEKLQKNLDSNLMWISINLLINMQIALVNENNANFFRLRCLCSFNCGRCGYPRVNMMNRVHQLFIGNASKLDKEEIGCFLLVFFASFYVICEFTIVEFGTWASPREGRLLIECLRL